MKLAAGLAVALGALGCFFRGSQPVADPAHGVEVITAGGVAEFHARATTFYDRLVLRRINAVGTFKDRRLRAFFRTEQAFSDYYAELAQLLADAHFERNRPLAAQVAEFSFDGPGRARVLVRLTGDNGLPLRYGTTVVERYDRWERSDDQWWIVPGKL